MYADPFKHPSQSVKHKSSLEGSASQIPHESRYEDPSQIFWQSNSASPPHTPKQSVTATPPHSPKQSISYKHDPSSINAFSS